MHRPRLWSLLRRHLAAAVLAAAFCSVAYPDATGRFDYLNDPIDPYYVGQDFPRLTTPQWCGAEGVDAVVILSIDDMRDPAVYERFLRPVLNRLKRIDGRAPVSILTNNIDSTAPQLQKWLDEGLSLEVHTIDHPCPLLSDGDLAKAKSTYERCVDMMADIPHSKAVAFRMPCCDSMNSPSPRFWTEIFDQRTNAGNFLQIDSSVFNVFSHRDGDLGKQITIRADGSSRFQHYLPFPSFVNTIENYPYPYAIGSCWEFPCVVPSDWEAQNVQQPNNPDTVRDLKIALDATVIKQGVMPIVFHPHGWIRSEQLVELVDYAAKTYGNRVQFLTFREALQRINTHLLADHSLRAADGSDGKVRLLDVNDDGLLDVIDFSSNQLLTRIWDPDKRRFRDLNQTTSVRQPRFGVLQGQVTLVDLDAKHGLRFYTFDGSRWRPLPTASDPANFIPHGQPPVRPYPRFRDLDGDGTSELLVTTSGKTRVLRYRPQTGWTTSPIQLPKGVRLLTFDGHDAGLRFVDLNEDGHQDIYFCDGRTYAVHLFEPTTKRWSDEVRAGTFGDGNSIPAIVRPDGTNNGVWFHSQHVWVQNEDTDRLPDVVDRFAFRELLARSPDDEQMPEAKSPAEALRSFSLSENARIELVAAEPLVMDPVAFDWGPDGALWVAEMGDYPNGGTWNRGGDPIGEPGGRIKRLVDTDGDGRFERAELFLDKVPFPTGVKAWRDGVIFTAAPNVVFAKDTDGDGQADHREVLFRGFRTGNQQHRVNGLRWGLDGWLYIANGDSGGQVHSERTDKTLDIRGRDLRIHPDTGEMETLTGQAQFGRCRDDHGNWFGCSNSWPAWHYQLDEYYLRRNPYYAPPSMTDQLSTIPGAAPVFPTSRTLTRFNDFDRANRFTSACGLEVFRDPHADSRRWIYVCEPVHNLVHREVLADDGIGFTSSRAASETSREFLASSDNWCRPVMARTGPDGALWIADMYRLVIEHPEWIPKTWQDRLDLRGGHDRGRIYRVVFSSSSDRSTETDALPTDWAKLGAQTASQLVGALDSPNGTLRDMVHQVLVWRADQSTVKGLAALLTSAKCPAARLHAMYVLESLGALTDEQLIVAIDRGGADARHAYRLAESRLRKAASPALFAAFTRSAAGKASSPADLRARQQLAYTLGETSQSKSGELLGQLAVEHADQPLITAAVLSSVNANNLAAVLHHVAQDNPQTHAPLIAQLLGMAIAYDNIQLLNDLMPVFCGGESTAPATWQLDAVGALIAAANREDQSLVKLLRGDSRAQAVALLAKANALATNDSADDAARIAAIGLLGNVPSAKRDDLGTLLGLLTPRTGTHLQIAAIDALLRAGDQTIVGRLVHRWRSFTPPIRSRLLDAFTARDNWTDGLLTAIERGHISADQVDALRRQRLSSHRNADIRSRAVKLFTNPTDRDLQAVVDRYGEALAADVDLAAGQDLFGKHCATCHHVSDMGPAIGPDLSALTDKSPDSLLLAILNPNRAVEDKYRSYNVVTTDGRQLTGLLAQESATALNLIAADAKRHSILRNDIEELFATGKSLMPEGLHRDIKPQEMANIITYVRSVSRPPKTFPGNKPQVAPMRDDGSIRLFAMHAKIYGPSLVFEPRYRNLGFWSHEADHAIWTVEIPRAGKYSIRLDYACDQSTAGNRFRISAAGNTLTGEVTSTGTWDDYGGKQVGMMELPAGRVEVVFQADGPVEDFLIDLRTVILQPVAR